MRFASPGFSLVELMLAMSIGLLVIAAVSKIYLVTTHSHRVQQELERMQENGRIAINSLANDLRRAGYAGLVSDRSRIIHKVTSASGAAAAGSTDDGHCNGTDWIIRTDRPVFGTDDHRTGYDCLPTQKTHIGDILVTRYALPGEPESVAHARDMRRHPDEYFLRTSASEGRLFEGSKHRLHPLDSARVHISRLNAHGYFIRTGHTPASGHCPGIKPLPSLYRIQPVNGSLRAMEIARGAEQLQVQYGIDQDNDGSVENYINAPTAADPAWKNVRSVRIWLLMRAECPETGYANTNSYSMGNIVFTPASSDLDGDGRADGDIDGDGSDDYRRELFSMTVALRNP